MVGKAGAAGGGSGGYAEALITGSFSATYTVTIGAAGTASGGGSFAGGSGGTGFVIVEELYQ